MLSIFQNNGFNKKIFLNNQTVIFFLLSSCVVSHTLLLSLLSSIAENEDALQNASSLPNDLLLSLFHSSLQNELSDREIALADGDHMSFMNHILQRERDGHVAPFSLPVIKGNQTADGKQESSFVNIQHTNTPSVTYGACE